MLVLSVRSVLILGFKPFSAKFWRYFIFFRVVKRVDLVKVREYVTLNDRRSEPFVCLLRLPNLFFENSVAHERIIGLEQGSLLAFALYRDRNVVEGENLLSNLTDVHFVQNTAKLILRQVVNGST